MFLRVEKEAKKEVAKPVSVKPVSVKPVANDGAFVTPSTDGAHAAQPYRGTTGASRYTGLKMTLHQRLLDMINLSVIDKMEPTEFRREIGEMVRELLLEENKPLNLTERTQLVDDILDELLGLGPLEPLLKDNTITDILCNTYQHVFIERAGRLELTPVQFKDNRHLLRIIDKIVSAVGRRVDESQPLVDARLGDGSRVNAVVPPLALDGPLLSIRKFSRIPIDMEKLVDLGSLTRRPPVARKRRRCIAARPAGQSIPNSR